MKNDMTYRIINENKSLNAILLVASDGTQFWIPKSWYNNGKLNERGKMKEIKARSEGGMGTYRKEEGEEF